MPSALKPPARKGAVSRGSGSCAGPQFLSKPSLDLNLVALPVFRQDGLGVTARHRPPSGFQKFLDMAFWDRFRPESSAATALLDQCQELVERFSTLLHKSLPYGVAPPRSC